MTSHKTNRIIFFIAVIVFAGTFIFSLTGPPSKEKTTSNQNRLDADRSTVSPGFKVPNTGISTYLGKDQEVIMAKFGKPERSDPTQYGYHWLIYGRGTENYVQIGIDDQTGKVTTIYALGKNLKTAPFVIEKHSRDIYKKVPLSDTVSLNYKKTRIEFEFNEEDLMMRPLIKFGQNWVQLNFDHMNDRLIGVRYMAPGVLVRQHPYSMTYEGEIPAGAKLDEKRWQAIDQAEDKEIFDLTNILRKRYGVKPLSWSNQARAAAFQHSKEMKVKNYFSHDSKWSGNLTKRLTKEKIQFEAAGENIAAKYPDATSVVLGWLNSEDHRKNLLSSMFTQLGAGVYHDYYTQDFVRPLQP